MTRYLMVVLIAAACCGLVALAVGAWLPIGTLVVICIVIGVSVGWFGDDLLDSLLKKRERRS